MSDTPRMDLALRKAQEDCTESYLLTEGLKLERELNAANERIKRLEGAGDAVSAIIGPPGSAHWADENQVDAAWNNWLKAKEDKL